MVGGFDAIAKNINKIIEIRFENACISSGSSAKIQLKFKSNWKCTHIAAHVLKLSTNWINDIIGRYQNTGTITHTYRSSNNNILNLKLLINSPCSAGNSDISNELLLQNTHSIRFVFSLFSLRVLQTVLPLPFLTQIENQKQCQMLIEINLHGHLGVWCVNYKLN